MSKSGSTVADAVGNSYSGDYIFCDEDHKVSVDGSEAIYYVLSKDEWTYLFNNHSKKWASVKGVSGYVIAPNDFSGNLAGKYADDAAWNVAQDAGVVFLPAAGSRDGFDCYNVGSYGFYWSSTADDGDNAYEVRFYRSSDSPEIDYRNNGISVRLITESSDGYALAVKVTGVTMDKEETTITVGEKETLVATIAPTNATNKQITWSSSKPSVATVNENGEVTGVVAGSAVIIATTADGKFTDVCQVTVKPLPHTTGTATRTGDIDVNWVQLWKDGPKFAEYNVGVTDGKAESYGGYYAWGGSQDKVDDHNTGESALSGESDTATKIWGSNWRMPTLAELQALLSSCDVEWMDGSTKKYNNTTVTGLLCKGKGAYASNSVFLPAAGVCYGGTVPTQSYEGCYWSSTPSDGNGADMYFRPDIHSVYGNDRGYGYSVRAVLAE